MWTDQRRFGLRRLQATVPLEAAKRFLDGDCGEKLPEVDAVAELLELALGRPCAEAVKGAQGDVLGIVGGSGGRGPETAASHRDSSLVIAPPEGLSRLRLPLLERVDPVRYRTVLIRHRCHQAGQGR